MELVACGGIWVAWHPLFRAGLFFRMPCRACAQVAGQQKEAHAADQRRLASANMGASTVEGFLAQLKRRFGNVPRAWRQCLDADGNNRLSRNEFYAACRGLNYVGNLKALWEALDNDGSGFIGLQELDAVAHEHLEAPPRGKGRTRGVHEAWLQGARCRSGARVWLQGFLETAPHRPLDWRSCPVWLRSKAGSRTLQRPGALDRSLWTGILQYSSVVGCSAQFARASSGAPSRWAHGALPTSIVALLWRSSLL